LFHGFLAAMELKFDAICEKMPANAEGSAAG